MYRTRTLLAAAAATALAVSLAACSSSGGGGGDGGGSGNAKSSAVPDLPGPAVKLGIIVNTSVTGTFGNPAPEVAGAAQAAVDAINVRGGVAGKKVELEVCDQKGDPNASVACARKFVTDGVIATVGDQVQDGPQYAPILDKAGIVRLGVLPLTQQEYTDPLSYPLQGGAATEFIGNMIYAKQLGKSKIHVVMMGVAGSEQITMLLKPVAAKLGMTYTGETKVPLTASDFSSYVAAAKNSGADLVIATLAPNFLEQFIDTSDQLGAKYTISSAAEAIDTATLNKLGPAADGMLLSSGLPPTTASGFPGVDQFNKELDDAQSRGDASLKPENRPHALNAWAAVHAFDLVTKSMSTPPTTTTLKAALDAAKDLDLGLGFTWTPNKPGTMLPRVSNSNAYFVQVKDGKLELASQKPVDVLSG